MSNLEPAGSFVRKIDANWRVTVPEVLIKKSEEKIILSPGFDNSIRGYTPERWEDFDHELKKLSEYDPDETDYVRFFRSMATTVEPDNNNRIRFTETLMNWAGLDEEHRDLVIFDAGRYIEFWEFDRWQQFMQQRAANIKDVARSIYGKHEPTGAQPATAAPSAGDGG